MPCDVDAISKLVQTVGYPIAVSVALYIGVLKAVQAIATKLDVLAGIGSKLELFGSKVDTMGGHIDTLSASMLTLRDEMHDSRSSTAH